MAISARQASLQAQKSNFLYGKSGGIRLLSPSNNSIASIAKKTATAELDVMVKNYNAGLISNDEMKAFLTKMQGTPGLSETDRADINIQLQDFDSRILKDKLEATYKAAPDNSFQQVQAAQALSSYYKQRAAGMQPGTPAYTDNINNASLYDQKIVDINDRIKTTARQNQRYIEEQKVNQTPSNSSERSYAKAQMWKNLYDQAVADGDMVDANKFASYYEAEITRGDELSQKETIDTEKTDLRNILGDLTNQYHDGKINEQQYLQALAEISPRIDATGDYGLINTLNRTTDIVQKNLEKGGLKRGTTSSGLPVVLGKGKGGSGGVTDWDKKDFDYSDNLRELQMALKNKQLTPSEYIDAIRMVVLKRVDDIQKQITVVEATAKENPNAKILFNGRKTRAEDVLNSLNDEYDKLDEQAGLASNPKAKLALVQIAPGEFNKSGDVSKSGKSFATYELVDSKNMPKSEYVQDNEGVFHALVQRERLLSPEEQANVYNNTLQDENGTIYKVRTDASSGNQYLQTKEKFVKVYNPGTSDYKEVAPGATGIVPNYTDAVALQTQTETTNRQLKIKKQKEDKKAQVLAVEQAKIDKANSPITKVTNLVNAVKENPVKTVESAVKPVADAVSKIAQPVASIKPVSIPKATSIAPDLVKLPQQNFGGGTSLPKPIALPQLKVAGLPSQTNTNLVKSGAKVDLGKAPTPKTVNPPKADQYSAVNSLKKIANTLSFGLLKF